MVHVADENWEMWWNGISYKHPPRSAGIGNKLIPPKIESDLRQFATHGSTHFGDENSDFLHDRLCSLTYFGIKPPCSSSFDFSAAIAQIRTPKTALATTSAIE